MDGLYKADDGAALRFWDEAVKNEFWSEKSGSPVYDQATFVEVITPGSKESAPVFELIRIFAEQTGITEPRLGMNFKRFESQFRAWKDGSSSGDMRGVPLKAWPAMDVATIATLHDAKVYTVEGLAAISDEKLRVIGPNGRSLRDRAIAFLSAAAGNAGGEAAAARISELETENERLVAERAGLDQQITERDQRIAELESRTAPSNTQAALPSLESLQQAPAPVAPPAKPVKSTGGNALV